MNIKRDLRPPAHLIAAVVLLALMAYAVAGLTGATFHGDEAMHLYSSRDYITAVVEGDAWALTTRPPYIIDSDAHLRILNGSVNRYSIGLARQLAGQDLNALPPRPGWDWGMSYADNAASGHRPPPDTLAVSRLPSTLLFALSIPVFYALALLLLRDQAPGPWLAVGLALLATAIYALHPVLLLNVRRAGQEGAMLCFGLLALLAAAHITRRRVRGARGSPLLWAWLIGAVALTLASKHSGVVFAASAFGWVFVGEVVRWLARQTSLRGLAGMTARLVAGGIAAGLLFIALSPALWDDPAARLNDLLHVRGELLSIQTVSQPGGGMSLGERVSMIGMQPFLVPPVHFEVASWGDDATIQAEIAAYDQSPLSGVQWGSVGGGLLSLGALLGLGVALWRLLAGAARPAHLARPLPSDTAARSAMAGLVLWLALTGATLMTNPLPWQRYYLPLMPIAALLVAVGLALPLGRWQRQRAGGRTAATIETNPVSGDQPMRALSTVLPAALLAFAVCLLAACAPAATPTPTLPPTPTDIPTPTGIPLESIPNLSLTVNAPAVGTLMPSVRDVFAPNAGDFQFSRIDFTRSDRDNAASVSVTLSGDGIGERRDSAQGTVTSFSAAPETLDSIRSQLNRMDFFGMQGTFEGPNTRGYSYLLTVSGDDGVRQVFAQDGYLPPELETLLTLLGNLGVDAPADAQPEATLAQ